jgi:epoxyqueuosine reductase
VDTERLKAVGRILGLDRVGIAPAEPSAMTRFFGEWIRRGYAGSMDWLPRRLAEREDPRKILAGARSIVCASLVYDPGPDYEDPGNGDACEDEPGASREPAEPSETPSPQARRASGALRAQRVRSGLARPDARSSEGLLARYAGGDDYHDVLRERLEALAAALEVLAQEPIRTRVYVDTGPVLERVHAARAGIGWIGKNTCLIDPELGSYVFLGVILTDLALPPDRAEPDHCGSCRACLDACPTAAFPEPYVLDASRCLSYTTIELRDAIPEALRQAQGAWVFGCDVCQQVCPWNARSRRRIPADPLGLRARLGPRPEWRRPTLAWLLDLDPGAWRTATRRTALRRARYRALLRNALVAAGNSGDAALLPALRRHAEGSDALLAEHARWALERLSGGAAPPAEPAPPPAGPR